MFAPQMTPDSSQPPTPHTIYKSVYVELIKALCSGSKDHSNRVGVIHACALY